MEYYLDTAATTPLIPEVREAIVNSFELYGNPSSLHRQGILAERAVEKARTQVAACLGVQGGRIVFTGCGTEADNLAIFGVARRFSNRGNHIITTAIEHPAVLEPMRALEREGFRVTYVLPQVDGTVAAEDVLRHVSDDTILVSMMHVNNETGALLPVEKVAEALTNQPKVIFHVDGIQAFGKVPHCARSKGIDLYSVSGHKLGAPKGIGALYIRKGLELNPVLYGGGQEFGLRSGTENVLGIVSLGEAAQCGQGTIGEALEHVQRLWTRFSDGLRNIPGCLVHRPEQYSPYVLNASFPGLKGEVIVHALESEGVYVSTGSACSTKDGHASGSHVLKAMGYDEKTITGTIRFSFGRWHTIDDIDGAIAIVRTKVEWLRSMVL